MIELTDVTKVFLQGGKEVKALQNINLTIAPQEVFGIVGQSGSGKSTLLRLINHLEQPSSGKVIVSGIDATQLSQQAQRQFRQKTGMIFQQFNLLSNKTVRQNIALPLKLQGKQAMIKVDQMLSFVNLTNKADYYPSQLSGGEKQRVAIARALVIEPTVLLCDEPTSALDEQHTVEILKVLQRVQATFATTIIIVSHEFSVIKSLCQRAAVLDGGKLVALTDVTAEKVQPTYDSYVNRALELLKR